MRRLPLAFSTVLFLASVTGCMHKGSNNSAAKSIAGYENSDQDLGSESNSRPLPDAKVCEDILRSMCTMEYNPQRCSYKGEAIEAGNPCGAKLRAQYIACQKSIGFKEDDLTCENANEVVKDDSKGEACSETPACTREFRPTSCKVEIDGKIVSERGNNRCESLNRLSQTLCSRKLAFDRATAACEDAR